LHAAALFEEAGIGVTDSRIPAETWRNQVQYLPGLAACRRVIARPPLPEVVTIAASYFTLLSSPVLAGAVGETRLSRNCMTWR
jgi:hypothetical protein